MTIRLRYIIWKVRARCWLVERRSAGARGGRVVGRLLTGVEIASQPCHTPSMVKYHKRPRDPAQLAKLIVDIAFGEIEDREPTPEEQGKDPAAVARGRLGGAKGGSARAQKLSPEERRATSPLPFVLK